MNTVNVELFGKDLKSKSIVDRENVSVTKAPVLIVEAGVERMLATCIHENSNRAEQILKFVDCAEDPENVENMILGFGNEESGRFVEALEEANLGTVVFAIDALEEDFQKRLHKILGELQDYEIDVRVIPNNNKKSLKTCWSWQI